MTVGWGIFSRVKIICINTPSQIATAAAVGTGFLLVHTLYRTAAADGVLFN